MVQDIVAHSQLDQDSRVDVFALSGWTTVPINQVVQVDCSTDIILRLRRSIQDHLSLQETPGLQELLDRQGRRIPSRTKRGASELVSPSKPKIPRIASDAPPLPSLLETMSSVDVPRVLIPNPPTAKLHPPNMPRHDTLNAKSLGSRFPGGCLAKAILSGLERVNCRDGRKVEERYEKAFERPYARATLNALRNNAAQTKPIFDSLDPGVQETITWGALIQTAKTSTMPQPTGLQPTPATVTTVTSVVNTDPPPNSVSTNPDPLSEMPSCAVTQPPTVLHVQVLFSSICFDINPVNTTSQKLADAVDDTLVTTPTPPRQLQPFPINFTNDPPSFNTTDLHFPPPSPLMPLANIFSTPSNSLMCPFCDDELPGTAFSTELTRILDEINARGGTRKDPTPENPNHLISIRGLTASVEFCVQHRHEKQQQTALDHGWPLQPDFIGLQDRVIELADKVKDSVITGLFNTQSPHQPRLCEHMERTRKNITLGNFGGSVSCG